jgi:hypothetical protein
METSLRRGEQMVEASTSIVKDFATDYQKSLDHRNRAVETGRFVDAENGQKPGG